MKKLVLLGAIAFGLNTFGQVPSYVPANGLVGWWSFSGNANDESGSGNNAVPLNGASLTPDRFGNSNMAYVLDGVDDHLTGTFNNFPIGSSARSVSGWIYMDDDFAWNHNLLAAWGWADGSFGSAYKTFGVGVNNNLTKANIWVSWGPTQNFIYPFAIGNWYFLTATIDQFQNASVYVNGQLIGTVLFNGLNTVPNNNIFHFGKSSYTASNGWGVEGYVDGKIDDIGVWNRALTYCEIQDLYHAQLNSSAAISAGADQVVCNSGNVTLNGSGGSNYQWSGGVTDGVPFLVSSNQTFTLIGEDSLGCLGSDQVNVTVQPTIYTTQVINACESYTWIDGNTYTSSTNTPTWTIPTIYGCDNVVTLDLTINNNSSVSTNMVVTACDSYTWINGVNYTSSTTSPSLIVPNSVGCDSLVTLNLTINHSTASSITASALDTYIAPSGATFTTSGIYTDIIPNAAGCDSIITINLTMSYTGLNELENNAIHIYPNPTSESITLQFSKDVSGSSIEIIDESGRVVLVSEVHSNAIKLDVSKLESGFYYITLDGVGSAQFVKQ